LARNDQEQLAELLDPKLAQQFIKKLSLAARKSSDVKHLGLENRLVPGFSGF